MAGVVLRAIAKRWLDLDAEIKTHELLLTRLTSALAPDLLAAFGIGADTAAEARARVSDDTCLLGFGPSWVADFRPRCRRFGLTSNGPAAGSKGPTSRGVPGA